MILKSSQLEVIYQCSLGQSIDLLLSTQIIELISLSITTFLSHFPITLSASEAIQLVYEMLIIAGYIQSSSQDVAREMQ